MGRGLMVLVGMIAWSGGTQCEAQAPAAQRPTDVAMVALMEQHYRPAIQAHDALIRDDLVVFRQQLAKLAAVALPPGSPEMWRPFSQQLKNAAQTGADATERDAAAQAMAAVALACGVCHQSVADGPVYPTPPGKMQDEPMKAQMRSHELSTLLLWNGVTGPSEFAWQTGAAGVAASRIFADTVSAIDAGQSLLAQEARLRALGAEAQAATVLAARAALYGRLLSTCGGCHKTVDIKLPPQ